MMDWKSVQKLLIEVASIMVIPNGLQWIDTFTTSVLSVKRYILPHYFVEINLTVLTQN
jgi:hypothetical protein